ncbi:uncharacterized protein DS421_19g647520 [Arachis hypogaea]|uniref:Uncharacterized protein n=1 Tax=Arachis hypogaea TaxID=3818 RepID=A0A6B9V653_ARAHY|nr:uncharacterized protein DS421_19g647520 [Arachis hypogaea]
MNNYYFVQLKLPTSLANTCFVPSTMQADQSLHGIDQQCRVFYLTVDPLVNMHALPNLFYRKYYHYLGNRMKIVDANRNTVHLQIIKGYMTAYIVEEFDHLVHVYRLLNGGIMKLRFLFNDIFYGIKVGDDKMASIPIMLHTQKRPILHGEPIVVHNHHPEIADAAPNRSTYVHHSKPLDINLNELFKIDDDDPADSDNLGPEIVEDTACTTRAEIDDSTYFVIPIKFRQFITTAANEQFVELPNHPLHCAQQNSPTFTQFIPINRPIGSIYDTYVCFITIHEARSCSIYVHSLLGWTLYAFDILEALITIWKFTGCISFHSSRYNLSGDGDTLLGITT